MMLSEPSSLHSTSSKCEPCYEKQLQMIAANNGSSSFPRFQPAASTEGNDENICWILHMLNTIIERVGSLLRKSESTKDPLKYLTSMSFDREAAATIKQRSTTLHTNAISTKFPNTHAMNVQDVTI
jgi:hypothetical protein